MAQRIKVVQYICGIALGEYNGGAEVFAVRLAQRLDPARYKVSICTMWWHGTPMERYWERALREQGIGVYYGSAYGLTIYPGMFRALLGSYPHLRALQPDIINTHVEFADALGDVFKLLHVAPVLVRTGHNTVEWPFSRRASPIMHAIHPFVCDAEVGVSRAVVRALDERPAARLLHRRARFIHNGTDAEIVLPQRTGKDVRALFDIPPEAPLFGVVARLAEQKGQVYLIRAMRQIRESLPGARLLLAGSGEQNELQRALVKELGLDDCVIFAGPRADAADLISGLDVFVLPSLWEGLPTVIMEAMLLGTPVVATDIEGTRDLVIDGVTGLLVPPADPSALAAALVRHYREREAAQMMAARAREHVEQFSMRRAAELYDQLYTELLRVKG